MTILLSASVYESIWTSFSKQARITRKSSAALNINAVCVLKTPQVHVCVDLVNVNAERHRELGGFNMERRKNKMRKRTDSPAESPWIEGREKREDKR